MKKISVLLLALCALSPAFAQTSVTGSSILTDLGSFAAGTYTIAATGTVDLVGNNTFTMNPDGTPNSPVTAPNYGYFNSVGSAIADGNYGPAGTSVKLGALTGSLSATPSQASDWFVIGYSTQVTLQSAGHIYASVNDTFRDNNSGAYSVSVTAVPEPESFAMLLAGLGLLGVVARKRKNLAS